MSSTINIILLICLSYYGAHSQQQHTWREIDVKRQTSSSEQCVKDRFNSSSLCMRATQGGHLLSASQTEFSEVLQEFCRPNCHNVILEADDECGIYRDSPGLRDFLIGLCHMNDNGQHCYEMYSHTTQFITNTELNCLFSFTQTGSCNCQSQLSSAVETVGCCLYIYHDYYETLFEGISYNPRDLYKNYCSVTLPQQCSSIATTPTFATTNGNDPSSATTDENNLTSATQTSGKLSLHLIAVITTFMFFLT